MSVTEWSKVSGEVQALIPKITGTGEELHYGPQRDSRIPPTLTKQIEELFYLVLRTIHVNVLRSQHMNTEWGPTEKLWKIPPI